MPIESVPAHLREAVASFDTELRALGFEPNTGLHVVPLTGEAWTSQGIAYRDATGSTRISCMPNPRGDAAGKLGFSLVTYLASGAELHTINVPSDRLMPRPPNVLEQAVEHAELATLVAQHRERVAAALAAGEVVLTLSDEELLARAQKRMEAVLELLRQSPLMTVEPDGRLVYRVGAAWRQALQLLRDEKARAQTLRKKAVTAAAGAPAATPPATPPPVVLSPDAQTEFDLESYRRLQAIQAGKMAWVPKALLMVGSLIVFALVLGWKLSVSTVVVLLAVLIFHEGGHLLGMRWFGHRDTQLLFLPFFGGAAVAIDERVLKPWQHLVILFLGPLPGLFIGLGLLVWAPQSNAWVREFTMMLIGLNVFNLLPILPLDGGQIMDTAFVTRFPRARLLFLGLSALGLVGVTFFVHGGTMLGILGLFMLLRLPVEWKTARLIKSLRRELPAEPDEDTVVRRVLAKLREPEWAKTAPAQRMQMVRGFVHTLLQPLPGWGTMALAVAGYLSPLWVPIAALAPLYGVGLWKLQRVETEARAAGLVRTPPAPLVVASADNAAADYAAAYALAEARMKIVRESYRARKKPGPQAPEERAALVAAIHRAAARPAFAPDRSTRAHVLVRLAAELQPEAHRLAAAGRIEEAARLVDDMQRIAAHTAALPTVEGQMAHLQALDTVLSGIEVMSAHALPGDAEQRWGAALDEARLRASLLTSCDAIARELLSPEKVEAAERPAWFAVFTWIGRWPAARADALAQVISARAGLEAGNFAVPAVDKRRGGSWLRSMSFASGALQLVVVRSQALGLVCRQRLARAAIALHRSGAAVGSLTEFPAVLANATGTHPVTRAAITLVTDKDGTVLRFGPRPAGKKAPAAGVADDDDDIELNMVLDEIEWRLTPTKVADENL
jgi:Zn-dependent protease